MCFKLTINCYEHVLHIQMINCQRICFLDCMSVVLEQQQNIEYYRFILSAGEVLTISQFKDIYETVFYRFANSLLYDLKSSRTSILEVCL